MFQMMSRSFLFLALVWTVSAGAHSQEAAPRFAAEPEIQAAGEGVLKLAFERHGLEETRLTMTATLPGIVGALVREKVSGGVLVLVKSNTGHDLIEEVLDGHAPLSVLTVSQDTLMVQDLKARVEYSLEDFAVLELVLVRSTGGPVVMPVTSSGVLADQSATFARVWSDVLLTRV